MSEIFYLKYRDTLPVLEVGLKNPDGTPYDLTGSTKRTLHIRLVDGTVLSRSMTMTGTPTDGIVRYAWQPTDWDAGGLVPSPNPILVDTGEHQMEYEVVNPVGRATFPNNGYNILRINPDFGQA